MRAMLTGLASFALVALPMLAPVPVDAKPGFTLEEYFEGKTVAKGVFESGIAGVRREFDVFLTGSWDGKILRLREDFVYADGEKDRKTWVFTKVRDGLYRGTREDLVGETTVTITGNIALFEYDVLIPRKGKKPIKVHFDDKMILEDDGLLINRARVSKFGFPIGKVAVNFGQGRIDDVVMPEL